VNAVLTWFAAGGRVTLALSVLALVLAFLVLERFWAISGELRAARAGLVPGREHVHRLPGLRRIGMIRACVTIAPLLGLLGTVCGIIDSFDSVTQGGYIVEMGRGISKALLTTQYGLAIAAPGLVAERILTARMDGLSRLVQTFHPADEEA
jgi:biopolymer transport protein ExbB/TolQ